MARRLTHKEAEARVAARGLELRSEYTKSKDKLWFNDPNCDHEPWQSTFNQVTHATQPAGCFGCSDSSRRPLTQEQAESQVAARGLVLISKYTNVSDRHQFYDPNCGHTWWTSFRNVTGKGSGCPPCRNADRDRRLREKVLTQEEAEARVARSGAVLVSEYTSSQEAHQFYSPECGHAWEAKFSDVAYKSSGCSRCFGYRNHEEAEALARAAGFELLSTYTRTHNKHTFKHLECGYAWEATYSNVIHNRSGCPNCANYGFNPTAPSIVYLIWANDYDVKVGKTNLESGLDPRHSSSARVSRLERSIPGKLWRWWTFNAGDEASILERRILDHYDQHRPRDPADGDGYYERIKGVHVLEVERTIEKLLVPAGTQLSIFALGQ